METRISALEEQKKNKNRINVYINGDFAFGLSKFVGRKLKEGQILSEAEINDLVHKESREKAYQIALRYISYKQRTLYEVEEKLEKSGFSGDIVSSVVGECEQKGYLDDLEYARQWVDVRSSSKPRSRRQLAYELRKRGISDNLISEAMEFAPEDVELAYELGKKYARRYGHLDQEDFKKKLFGVLARRAFSFDVVNKTVNKLVKEKFNMKDKR